MSRKRFHDDNFRLACLDILLGAGHFHDELSEILKIPDFEEGWEVNPKRIKAFRQLPVTQDHLDEITSFAPDGGDDIYFHVFPKWSGGEKQLYIHSFHDVKKLRNLESIWINSVTDEGAFDLSLLLSLKKLKIVDTDYFYLSSDCDFEATVSALEQQGVAITIRGKRRTR
jgi:hypothetical protein